MTSGRHIEPSRGSTAGAGRTVETVVTYLAMQPPPRSLPPMPARPRLALMRAEQIPLHYYRYLYGTVGRPWLWIERLSMSDNALAARIHRDGVEIMIAYANGSPAGFFEIDFGQGTSTDLSYFGLVPDWIGHKIGPWLLGAAVSAGLAHGAKRMTVNTCTMDHPAALPLYQRLGFVPVNQQRRRFSVPEGIEIPGHILAGSSPSNGTIRR